MRYATLMAAAVACLLCGCSTTADEPLAVRKEPVYRTGSNIAVKDPNAVSGVLSVRPDEVHTTNLPARPLGSGGVGGPASP
jgi:hypothetical protein